MIEAKGEIEGRVPVPGAFGVQEHRPVGSGEDVLGADVAVDQGRMGVPGDAGQVDQRRRQFGMRRRRGFQVRGEADGVKDGVGRELGLDGIVAGGGGVNLGDPVAHPGGEICIHAPGQQVVLP